MQTFNTVRLEDKLLFPDDMVNVVSVVSEVPVASAASLDQYVFLKNTYKVDYTVGGVVAGTQVLQSGKIYRCKSYTYVDPITGVSTIEYKWVNVSFAENGKLLACTNDVFTYQENALADGGGWSVIIHWEDPIDIIDSSNPASSAVWAYTVIVRKLGKNRPATIYDGDIVGYSSVRNQYKSGTGFVDFIPEEGYTYNIFAVTRYGVATGLDDSGGTEVEWATLRQSIWDGTSGLSLGSTIPVTHDQYGSLTLQVVAMRENDDSLVNVNPKNLYKRSVVFMSYNPLPRSAFDVPELAEAQISEGVMMANPGDSVISPHKCSEAGHCLWAYSNLRQWLNQDEWVLTTDTFWDDKKTYGTKNADGTYTPVEQGDPGTPIPSSYLTAGLYEFVYILSTDAAYNVKKCYYVKNTSGEYTAVPTPTYPSKVSPAALGYYEATWKWRPRNSADVTAENYWDVKPDPFKDVDPDAGYTYDGKALPGFLCGFPAAFRNVLATVKVNTITDTKYFEHSSESGGGLAERHLVTQDKVFIPSYRELVGTEPPGISGKAWYNNEECREGTLFPFYDPSISIPDISFKERSLVKYDMTGGLNGYFLRSIGTSESGGSKELIIRYASTLWMVSCDNMSTRPDLDKCGLKTHDCSMTIDESYTTDSVGNRVAPGVAWCVVIG